MIGPIARTEVRRFLVVPGFWVLGALMQAAVAWLFFIHLDKFVDLQPRLADRPDAPGVTDLVVAPTLIDAAALLLLLTPLLAMRSFSEERKGGSLALLQAAPLGDSRILLGKFIGLMTVLLIPAAIAVLMTMSLLLGSAIDLARIATAALALVLTAALTAAAGLWISAGTRHPPVAAALLYGLFLFLWIAGMAESPDSLEVNLLQWLALPTHLQPLLEGRIRSGDLGYFAVMTGGFLTLARLTLSSLRGSGA